MPGIQGKIAASMKGAGKQATNDLGAEIESNSGGFQGAIGKLGGIAKAGGLAIAAGIGAGVVGLGALLTKSLEAGAELEQQIGGSEAVFEKFAKNIQAKADDAYTNMGLSQNEFLQGVNKMGSLFQGAGFSVEQSMNMSSDAMQRASDVASIMGISTTDALEAVTGMAKGNFTMMDNLGVAINDTTIGQYALSKGINKSTQEMTTQEKVGLANQLFMEKTAKYAGNYAKENDSLSGSINTTKKAFQDFMATGNPNGFVNSLVHTIQIAVPKIVELLPTLVKGISSILGAIIPALSAALPTLIPALISAVQSLLNALITALPTILQALVGALPMFINAFIQIFLAIVKALPQIIQILAAAIPQIVDAIVNGLTKPESLQAIILGAIQLLIAIIQAIPVIVTALVKAVPTIVQNIIATLTSSQFIGAMFNAGVQLLKATISGLLGMIGAVLGAAGQVIGAIAGALSPGNLARIGGDMIKGLWNGISDLTGWITGKLKGFGDSVLKGIKNFFGIHSPSTVFAGIGENLNLGLAKGLESSAGVVTGAVDSVANQALNAMTDPTMAASVAYTANGAGIGAGLPAASGNNTQQDVRIGQVVLGDKSAVQEFFNQLNQDTMNVGMGLTPVQGGH